MNHVPITLYIRSVFQIWSKGADDAPAGFGTFVDEDKARAFMEKKQKELDEVKKP